MDDGDVPFPPSPAVLSFPFEPYAAALLANGPCVRVSVCVWWRVCVCVCGGVFLCCARTRAGGAPSSWRCCFLLKKNVFHAVVRRQRTRSFFCIVAGDAFRCLRAIRRAFSRFLSSS